MTEQHVNAEILIGRDLALAQFHRCPDGFNNPYKKDSNMWNGFNKGVNEANKLQLRQLQQGY